MSFNERPERNFSEESNCTESGYCLTSARQVNPPTKLQLEPIGKCDGFSSDIEQVLSGLYDVDSSFRLGRSVHRDQTLEIVLLVNLILL